jgi:hypothetical protein
MERLHWREARAEGDARAEVVMASKQVVGCLVEIWQIDASGLQLLSCFFFLPAFGGDVRCKEQQPSGHGALASAG